MPTIEATADPMATAIGQTTDMMMALVAITTRLVDTAAIPMLLKLVRSGKLQPAKLVTHRFALGDIMKAYDTFGNAAKERALKVILTNGKAGQP